MPNGIFTLKQQEDALIQSAWTNQKTPAVDYLVVAGGGGAGRYVSGGGGAGGLLQGNVPVSIGTSITVTVGGGGAGSSSAIGTNGDNSVFGSITSTGGGGGGRGQTTTYSGNTGASGGSGGGGGTDGASGGGIGQGIFGQGNSGGTGSVAANIYGAGGGGGAGTVGLNGTAAAGGIGGAGVSSNISGTRTVYAGGGGGAEYGAGGGISVSGGAGGGGQSNPGTNGSSGTANTGGGGGGTGTSSYTGGSGGSGIVIISYPDTYQAAASTTGSPTVGTSGSGSISFNGSSQYMRYGAQSGFALGAGDFTLELFVYLNSLGSGDIVIFDARPQGTQGVYPTIYFNSSTLYWFVNSGLQITGTGALAINTWYHIAVSRIGTSTKMFVNGSQVGSTYTDSNNYLVGSERPAIATGGYSFGSNLMNGYISNIRIVKGTGLYSSNFTAPAAPLTPVAGTSFLLNTASGAYAADSSGNGYAPVATGTPAWNSLSPFATGLGYKNRVYTWTSSGSITF